MKKLFLSMAGFADADHRRRRPARRWRWQKIALQGMTIQPRQRDDFTCRIAKLEKAAGAFLHRDDRSPAPLVCWIQRKNCSIVVVDGTKPVAPRRRHMARGKRRIGPIPVRLCHAHPLAMPGKLVASPGLSRHQQAFGNGGPAVLGRSEKPDELGREVFPFRPERPFRREARGNHLQENSIADFDN